MIPKDTKQIQMYLKKTTALYTYKQMNFTFSKDCVVQIRLEIFDFIFQNVYFKTYTCTY